MNLGEKVEGIQVLSNDIKSLVESYLVDKKKYFSHDRHCENALTLVDLQTLQSMVMDKSGVVTKAPIYSESDNYRLCNIKTTKKHDLDNAIYQDRKLNFLSEQPSNKKAIDDKTERYHVLER